MKQNDFVEAEVATPAQTTNPYAELDASNPYAKATTAPATLEPATVDPLYNPAMGIRIVSIAGLCLTSISFFGFNFRMATIPNPSVQDFFIFVYVFYASLFVISILGILGSNAMFARRNRRLAIIGSAALLAPGCSCYLITIPFGIWGLRTLFRPEVIALFEAAKMKRDQQVS